MPNVRIPVAWEARDYDKFRVLVEVARRVDIDSEMNRIHVLVLGEVRTKCELRDVELERIAEKAQGAQDGTVRNAYRHLFRERARALKLRKEWHDSGQLPTRKTWLFFGTAGRPGRLQIPDSLEGQPDRQKWNAIIRARYQDLR